jgi:hypothetical protein
MTPRTGILMAAAAALAALMLGAAPALKAATEISAPVESSPKALSATAAAAAAATPTAPAATPEPAPQTWFDKADAWIDQTKTPVPWMKWGADLRVRDEYLSSAGLDAESRATGPKDNHTNWLRIRARWWRSEEHTSELQSR